MQINKLIVLFLVLPASVFGMQTISINEAQPIRVVVSQNDINLLGSEGYIFMIENSKFIKKIHEVNLDYYKYLGVTFSHYLIYTRENLIEILTNYPPVITIEGSDENTTTREPSKGE